MNAFLSVTFNSVLISKHDCKNILITTYFLGSTIKEFIGLRPKMYSLIYDVQNEGATMEKEKRTAKGIAKSAIDQQIRHFHYKQCLFDNRMTLNEMALIRSQNHILFVNNVRKFGLCNFDDKKFFRNSVHGLSYGHYKIENLKRWCNVFV